MFVFRGKNAPSRPHDLCLGDKSLMRRRCKHRLTIRQSMALIAIAGIFLGLFAAYPNDQVAVGCFLVAFLVVVIPVHFAIEGNRRDPIVTGFNRGGHPDQEDSPGPV